MSLSGGAPSLRCELVTAERAVRAAAAASGHLLLAVAYGAPEPARDGIDSPWLPVPNRVLAGGPTVELWSSLRPVRAFRRGALAWAEDGAVLAGCLERPSTLELESATHAQFAELLGLLDERGHPHLLRVWNYLPAINQDVGAGERYRIFNAGRARAFAERYGAESAPRRYPASSAVGTPGATLRTAFLASSSPPTRIENPRQTCAFLYPPRYGEVSPSFSRATVAAPELDGAFFLSGTASISGHETRHPGSLEEQLVETLRNVDAVTEVARARTGLRIPPFAGLDLIKVYLRHADQLERVRAALASALSPATPAVVLEAEICRGDLLVEIDGFALGECRRPNAEPLGTRPGDREALARGA